MRFFISRHESTTMGSTICIVITTDYYADAAAQQSALKEEFGPWMLLGVKEYTKNDFIDKFSAYIPSYVLTTLNTSPTNFIYKAAIHISND